MDLEQSHAVEAICTAITSISHGDINGPKGLEGVAMAIAGEGPFGQSGGLAAAVTDGFDRLATAIEQLTQSLELGEINIVVTHRTKEN